MKTMKVTVKRQSRTPAKQPPPGSGRLTPQMKGKLIKRGLRELMR